MFFAGPSPNCFLQQSLSNLLGETFVLFSEYGGMGCSHYFVVDTHLYIIIHQLTINMFIMHTEMSCIAYAPFGVSLYIISQIFWIFN